MGKKSHFFAWIIESWWRFIHFCCRLCVLYIVYINCCLMVCYLQEWIDHALKNAPLLSIYMWLCLCCCIVSNLHKIKSFSHSWKLFGCTLYKGSSALFEHFQGWFIWSHRMLLPLGSRRCSGEIFLGKNKATFGVKKLQRLPSSGEDETGWSVGGRWRRLPANCYNSMSCASSSLKSLILDSLDELTSAGSRRLRSASSEAYLRT